jgi:hypothetical protein
MAVELNQNGLPNSIQIDQKLRRSILSAATTNHRSMLPAPGCSHLLTSVLTPPNDNANKQLTAFNYCFENNNSVMDYIKIKRSCFKSRCN